MDKPPSPDSEEKENIIVVPVIEEEARVSKRTVDRGKVRIERRIETEVQSFTELLRSEDIEVTRVPIDEPVEKTPLVREEGDEIVVPVLEERMVVTKQVFLKEELRIRRTKRTEPATVTEEVRKERVDVRREEQAGPHPSGRRQ